MPPVNVEISPSTASLPVGSPPLSAPRRGLETRPNSGSSSPGDDRAAELLGVAIDVFGEAGFAGARIDEVARRVGIRRSSVLYHYRNKSTLYFAAIAHVVSSIADRVRAASDRPGERLGAIADAWIDFVIEEPQAARLLLRQLIDAAPLSPGPESARPESMEMAIGQVLEVLQSAIDERAPEGSASPIDATEFALILSSTSLVWVAGRNAVEGTFGFDTLSPAAIRRHRATLHSLIRRLVTASEMEPLPGEEPDPPDGIKGTDGI